MRFRQLFLALSAGCISAVVSWFPAQARPRDEVMSAAFRCAAIGESRRWLDCFYGAAQPARAALGLQPAPSAQTGLVSSPPSGNEAPLADVATRDAVLSGAFRCRDLAEDHQWLNCYYAAAQPMRAALGLSPAPHPAPVSGAVHPSDTPPAAAPGMDANVDHIASRMASYKFDKYGLFMVTLVNGQSWRQVSGDTDNAHWKKPAASYAVRITHGFLGSYNLQVQNNPGLFKVLPVP